MSLDSVFAQFPAFGFSGSRSPGGAIPVSALSAAAGAVPSGSPVLVGCAKIYQNNNLTQQQQR